MDKACVYKVTFFYQGSIYEIYAKNVSHGNLYGFVEVGDLIFSQSGIVVDPVEEKLKAEFSGVKRTYIPMHAVFRIDAVEKEGVAKIREQSGNTSNVTQFPMNMYTPGDK